MSNLPKGKLGEDLATAYLLKKGYRIIARNFRAYPEEIDIIATHKNTLVFIEVKTRFSTSFGSAVEAITSRKLANLVKGAHYFKSLKPKLPESLRIDLVAVQLTSVEKLVSIEHIENISG